jgi:hypothetical protein
MSTKQTDTHMEYQQRLYQDFVTMVDDFGSGLLSYDYIEEALDDYRDDDDVDTHTYEMCKKYWDDAVADESFWQEEDRLKWEQIKDSNVY